MDGNMIHANNFAFDLQRFTTWTLTKAETTYTLKADGQQEITSTTSLSDLLGKNDVASGDTIKLGGTITETAKVTIGKNLTLDLNGQTLTTSASIGFEVSDGKTFTVNDTSSEQNGLIVHTDYNDKITAKKNRSTKAAIWVGGNPNNTNKTTFNMKGGKISSKGVSVWVPDNSEITVDGGTIESEFSSAFYFQDDNKNTIGSKLTMTAGTLKSMGFRPTVQVGGYYGYTDATATAGYATIDLKGGKIIYEESDTAKADKVNDTDIKNNDDRSKGAIFASGKTVLTIEDGVEIESSHVGIEFRAGTLNVNGGTITSTTDATADSQIEFHKTTSGTSFTDGVAIAISKSSTQRNITANINGGTISGYTALAIANPNDKNKEGTTTTVNVKGGTLISTSKATTDESSYNSTVPEYTLKGRNAIVNFDKDVTVNLSDTTVKGSVAAVLTNRTGDYKNGYNIGEGNTFSNFDYTNSSGLLAYYNATSSSENFSVAVLGVDDGWTRKSSDATEWAYLVQGSASTAATIAALAPSTTEEEKETVLKLTSTDTTANTVSLNLTNTNVFSNIDNYTVLDASGITNTNLKFNITGNETLTSIIGGSGADSLTAGVNGATLNGGSGDDSLVAVTGTEANTFIHQSGSDTIDGYKIANYDIVSVTSAPSTDLANDIKYDSSSSEFVFRLGDDTGDSLTFHSASEIKLNYKEDVEYYYRPDRVIKDNSEATLGAAFSGNFNVNKLSSDYVDYSSVAKIDASAVTVAGGINITGSEDTKNLIKGALNGGVITGGDDDDILEAVSGNTTLNGGAGDDSLKGGDGANVFIYDGNAGGTDSISGYKAGDLVNVRNFKLSDAEFSSGDSNISLSWGGDDKLVFEDVEGKTISVKSGSSSYIYTKNYYAHNKGVTLASGHGATYDGSGTEYATINAAAVNNAISVMGNSLGNYIFGATAQGGTLNGDAGNDKLNVSERGTEAKYLFEFAEGKDEVFGFKQSSDTVSIAVADITAAKASTNKLTLTIDKNNSFALNSDDDITKVSLAGSETGPDYLTKDGYVNSADLKLFGSAKGRIDLNDDYKESNITAVDAQSVKSQSVTLVGGTQGGTFTYYEGGNKQKDGFVYGGGSATIVNYEAGKDKIDLGAYSLTSFALGTTEADSLDVSLRVGDGTSEGVISLVGARGKEVLLHDESVSRTFKKMVFAENGVVQTKATKPTTATISSGLTAGSTYNVPTTVKKVVISDVGGVRVKAGDSKNTILDASGATSGVSLEGGAKNDKLIGSAYKDTFIYTAGKDVIQEFGTGDNISLDSSLYNDIVNAKITAGSKSIKFKFSNKNTLTIKATKSETLSGALNINGVEQTYVKNAIAKDGAVTLTSSFSGTFKTVGTKGLDTVSTVNGGAVKKNLTFKGSEAAESLVGGQKKTTFKGGGGADTLVGGDGKDVFFYAKGDAGTTTIANFEFGANKDKLKIASGTIGEISTINGGIQFAMNSGKKGDTSNIGWFQVTSDKDGNALTPSNVAIKANNTYYWLNQESELKDVSGNDVAIGQLITSDSRVSASDVSSFEILDLNYSTNLAKAGVAVKVTGAKPK